MIDTASGSVVKTIDASADWPDLDAVAVAPDGQRVYVSNHKKGSVLVIGP